MKIKKLFSIVAAATVLVGAASLLASCKNAADNKTNNDSSKGQMQSDSPVRAEQAEQEFKAAIKALDDAKTEALKNDDVKKELNKVPAVGEAVAPKEYGDYTKAEAAKTAADKALGEKEKAHADKLKAILSDANVGTLKGLADANAYASGEEKILKAIADNEAELKAYVEANLKDAAGATAKTDALAAIAKAKTLATTPGTKSSAALGDVKIAVVAAYGADGAGTAADCTKKGVTDAETAVKTKEEELAKAEAALSDAVGKADATAVEKAQKAVIIDYVVQVEKEASEAKGKLDTAMGKTPGTSGATAAEIAAEQAATKAAYVQAQDKAAKVKNVKAALDKVVVKAEQVTRAAETDKTEKIQKAVLKICEIIAKSGVEDSTLKSKIDEAKNIIK